VLSHGEEALLSLALGGHYFFALGIMRFILPHWQTGTWSHSKTCALPMQMFGSTTRSIVTVAGQKYVCG
jgi:hypothetical protein